MLALIAATSLVLVAPIFVGPEGNDSDRGSKGAPLKTVAAAIASGTKEIVLLPGEYALPDGITLGAEQTGLRLRAEMPGSVRLVGGLSLPYQVDAGTKVARIPAGRVPNQAFLAYKRLTLAREPNTGYANLESGVEGRPRTAFVLAQGFLAPGVSPVGARAFYWPTHNWFSANKPITAYDPATRTIEMEGEEGYDITPGNRFFLFNHPAFLDADGEATIWDGVVRFIGSETGPLTIATAPALIKLSGAVDVRIEGLILSVASGHVVEIGDGSRNCVVAECQIENGGASGISIGPHAQGIRIERCEIRENQHMGVEIGGPGVGGRDTCFGNTVEGCYIHHCGRLQGHGYGVVMSNSGKNRVVNNVIHDMPRYGVSIKGTRFHGIAPGSIPGLTFENRHTFFHARENVIAFNDIYQCNQDSQDTGAIESWGPGRDNVIDHNLIHDSGNAQFDLQSGIYLDDAADYFTVTNNVIWGIKGTRSNQPIFAKGIGNRIENNILIVDPSNEAAIMSMEMADERCYGHIYLRNIVSFEPLPKRASGAVGNWGGGVGSLEPIGKTLFYSVEVPKSGKYDVWLYYAAHNEPFGNRAMDDRCSFRVNGSDPVPLINLPDTGDWGRFKFSPGPVAEVELREGENSLVWRNDLGGGINIDAWVLSMDPEWRPSVPGDTPEVITLQAEAAQELRPAGALRMFLHFVNWADDRVADSDWNLIHQPEGEVAVFNGPEADLDVRLLSWSGWQKRFDTNSVLGDPLFVAPERRNYALRPGSPALKIGFRPIDFDRIGLPSDYPTWLGRPGPWQK